MIRVEKRKSLPVGTVYDCYINNELKYTSVPKETADAFKNGERPRDSSENKRFR